MVDLAIGFKRSCAVFDDGGLRCWGLNGAGFLGYPFDTFVGDDEHPFEVGDVPTGGAVRQVVLPIVGICVLYMAGNVRCLGANGGGALGYGHKLPVVGVLADIPDVPLGEPAVQLVSGLAHMCARLASGGIRCWGAGNDGTQGYGDGEQAVGDDETPAEKPLIEIGSAVADLSAGGDHTCALLAGGGGRVRCWGYNSRGELGLGHTEPVGDDEVPAVAGDVSLGGSVRVLEAFGPSTCVVLENGTSRCWGAGSAVLGYADRQNFGDDEQARVAPALALGGVPRELGGGPKCAIMSDGSLRCWGSNREGQLGYGHTSTVGFDGDILSAGTVQLGGAVSKLAIGYSETHTCALLVDGQVRCWGMNSSGELGLGHQENVGDDELPMDVPPVRLLE